MPAPCRLSEQMSYENGSGMEKWKLEELVGSEWHYGWKKSIRNIKNV